MGVRVCICIYIRTLLDHECMAAATVAVMTLMMFYWSDMIVLTAMAIGGVLVSHVADSLRLLLLMNRTI